MKKLTVGILAHRVGNIFPNSKFLSDLVTEGRKLGACVYVFSHKDVQEDSRTIRGFTPISAGRWAGEPCPWPDVVIDFCRKLYKPFRDMRRREDLFVYANHKFTYKWKAMKLFAESDKLKRWIPKTFLYSPQALEQMIETHDLVYVKPGNGTGGHSVLKINKTGDGYRLQGRKRSGRIVATPVMTKQRVIRWINRWVQTEKIRSGSFMVQQGLDLQLIPRRQVDVRLLIQKNEIGNWEVTGKVLRVGAKNSPTTNLSYGDGKAMVFQTFIHSRFGLDKAKEIELECEELAHRLMEVVEERFGSMVEFGLDVGIDVNGQVWLIEANPKPGHRAFIKAKESATYLKSIRRPIQYAIHLANEHLGEGTNDPCCEQAIRENVILDMD
ncbi:YheC/D like ATP-grasp [Paenibacillus tianmuensis]|uniref:YheC/D like ATP-grasp n=1 Tax=Paenibacillus tianmuensis TaxID=624147 RepID=A0A1G4S838_9BACL|nr:YheC/YheD family protein [Paenibacillus tianmuensis]SCW65354.1 YheC/D like ATP-grasp [Paenibacillus tianmuensis]